MDEEADILQMTILHQALDGVHDGVRNVGLSQHVLPCPRAACGQDGGQFPRDLIGMFYAGGMIDETGIARQVVPACDLKETPPMLVRVEDNT